MGLEDQNFLNFMRFIFSEKVSNCILSPPLRRILDLWLYSMAQLYCWTYIRVRNQTWISNRMATLYYAEHVHIAQTRTRIPTAYLCIGQKSQSESLPVSEPGNVFKPKTINPWHVKLFWNWNRDLFPQIQSWYQSVCENPHFMIPKKMAICEKATDNGKTHWL